MGDEPELPTFDPREVEAEIDRVTTQFSGDTRPLDETYDKLVTFVLGPHRRGGVNRLERWIGTRIYNATGHYPHRDEHPDVVRKRRTELARARRAEPNGPNGSWYGSNPYERGEPRPPWGQAVVYVLLDDQNVHCYVGSTQNLGQRLNDHRWARKRWSWWVAYPCETRERAYILEEQMLDDRPGYLNVQYSDSKRSQPGS